MKRCMLKSFGAEKVGKFCKGYELPKAPLRPFYEPSHFADQIPKWIIHRPFTIWVYLVEGYDENSIIINCQSLERSDKKFVSTEDQNTEQKRKEKYKTIPPLIPNASVSFY